MKVEVTIAHNELMQAIHEYVAEKIGQTVALDSLKLYVKSKENYRLKTFERAELIVTTKPLPSKPMDAETELQAAID